MNRWQPAPRLRGRIRHHLRGLLRQRLGRLLGFYYNLRLLLREADKPTSAFGRLGDRVPLAPGLEERSAALASRREAGVSTAAAAIALARESVAIHIHAASVASCDAHIATATVTACACETIAVAIAAMNRWQPAPRLRGRIRRHLRGLL